MLELPHAFVGITIVYLIPNPLISLPLCLLSHFIFDSYPHWNPLQIKSGKNKGKFTPASKVVIASDFFLSLGTIFYYGFQNPLYAIGAMLAISPDLLFIPKVIFKKEFKLIDRFNKFIIPFHYDLKFPYGLLTQLLVILICLIILN